MHGCRFIRELAYEQFIREELPKDEFIGDMVGEKLLYHPMVTREPYRNTGRITAALDSGRLAADLGLPAIDPANDRFMLCGSPAMLHDVGEWLVRGGFREGSSSSPGEYVIEKAFVER